MVSGAFRRDRDDGGGSRRIPLVRFLAALEEDGAQHRIACQHHTGKRSLFFSPSYTVCLQCLRGIGQRFEVLLMQVTTFRRVFGIGAMNVQIPFPRAGARRKGRPGAMAHHV